MLTDAEAVLLGRFGGGLCWGELRVDGPLRSTRPLLASNSRLMAVVTLWSYLGGIPRYSGRIVMDGLLANDDEITKSGDISL